MTHSHFDHLVIGIRSLDEGIDQFQQLTGVKAAAGGRHPGRGTENALVSLGPGAYLEIIAPQPDAKLSESDEKLRGLDQLTIVTWAITVEDAVTGAAALAAAGFETTPPQRGSRVTPAGERLEWTVFRLTGNANALAGNAVAVAPFFIQWSRGTRHPSTTAPGGCALDRLVVHAPEPEQLSVALEALSVTGITLEPGGAGIEAEIRCGARRALMTTY